MKSGIQNILGKTKSLTEAKRDILPALAQLSLDRLLLSRAYLRFNGHIKTKLTTINTLLQPTPKFNVERALVGLKTIL